MRLALLLLMLASACMSDEKPVTAGTGDDACGAAALQHLVGEPAAEHTFGSGDQPVRIIPPGLSVTMDYNPERLNVETDESGIITRIYCG